MCNNHYSRQTNYFNAEFSQKDQYQLLPWKKAYIRRISSYLLKKNFTGKTLLDIGAGSAYVTIEMAKIGLKVIALDLSRVALNNIDYYKSKFHLKNIKTVYSNAEKLPFNNESIDYIVANAVLEHIYHETKAIDEWKRVLKPGGMIMITVPLKYRYVWPFLWLINYIHDKQIGHLRRYDLNDLRSKFKMKIVFYLYTGHLIKAIWVIFSILFNTDIFNEQVEVIDEKKKDKCYGASNIIVIFEK